MYDIQEKKCKWTRKSRACQLKKYGEGLHWIKAEKKCACGPGKKWSNKKCRGQGNVHESARVQKENAACRKRGGIIYLRAEKKCTCPSGQHWHNKKCSPELVCTIGKVFDRITITCKNSAETETCIGHGALHSHGGTCVCKENHVYEKHLEKCIDVEVRVRDESRRVEEIQALARAEKAAAELL